MRKDKHKLGFLHFPALTQNGSRPFLFSLSRQTFLLFAEIKKVRECPAAENIARAICYKLELYKIFSCPSRISDFVTLEFYYLYDEALIILRKNSVEFFFQQGKIFKDDIFLF